MKNNFFSKATSVALCAFALLLSSCESTRDDSDDTFSSMDAFYNTHRQEEQEFIVDSVGKGPIVGKQNTRLYADTSLFMYPGGSDVKYPFTIKLIELYSHSDFVEYPMSTVAGDVMTESAGAMRVRAYKDGVELVLKPNKSFVAVMTDTNNLLNGMRIFYGANADTDVSWTQATDGSSVVTNTSSYTLALHQMGWVNCAQLRPSLLGVAAITFVAEGSGTEFIDVYLIAKNYFSVVKVKNLQSIALPLGEPVTVIAMAMDQNKKYRLHSSTLTVGFGITVTLDMKVVTEQDVLNALSAL